MIKRLKFAGIPTADQQRSLDFWTAQLGFRVLTDQPFGDQRWIELGIPGAETAVVLFTPEGHEERIGQFQSLSFECDDLERTVAQLRERGVEFEGEIRRADWGNAAIFKDPDGNSFVMSER
jgi:catechol 2,3-dioxygenase-like lactoylglutathione lyase family enzyme